MYNFQGPIIMCGYELEKNNGKEKSEILMGLYNPFVNPAAAQGMTRNHNKWTRPYPPSDGSYFVYCESKDLNDCEFAIFKQWLF